MKKKLSVVLTLLIITQLMFMNGYSIADNFICTHSSNRRVVEGLIKDATCTEPAKYSIIRCADCGEIVGTNQYFGEPLGHYIVNTNQIIPATCTTPKKIITQKCTRSGCDYEIFKYEGQPEHQYKNATCTTPKTCVVCGTTTGNASGHDFSAEWIIKEATCTEGAKYISKCTRCEATDDSKIRVTAPLGHIRGEGTVTKEPTCEETGIMTYGCSKCTEVAATNVIESLGHEYNNGVCIRCENELPKIESTNYKIEDNYIIGIKPGATIEEIKNNIINNVEYEIVKPDGSQIQSNENVGTGCKIQFTTGESYIIVVTGDVDGDGEVNVKDLARIKKHIAEITQLQGECDKAADINKDGKIDITDIAQMKKAIAGLIQL